MPAITTVGDIGSGHDACAPTALLSGSNNCFINNKSACRATDPLEPHGCSIHTEHPRMVSQGSTSIYINNLPAARLGDPISLPEDRLGDPISCGGLLVQGSGNSFFG